MNLFFKYYVSRLIFSHLNHIIIKYLIVINNNLLIDFSQLLIK
jgi:hypothetical protein